MPRKGIQIIVILAFLDLPFISSAQSISGIITDYNGFWKTSSASPNPKKPDKSHNLLAFTYKGVQYSTGVNDDLLTQRSENYVPGDFWALPVNKITGALNSNTKAGFGALYDGVVNGAGTVPPDYGVSIYLTDGIKGLNIGTCIANLPNGDMTFILSNIQPISIGDGIPDVVVTQVADPSGSYDRYEFTDESGMRVGNFKDIIFTNISPVANWTADFYEAKVNPLQLLNGFTQTDRPMRLWAADLSEFGITAANYNLVRNFKINLSGQSDVAFVAYNSRSVSFQNALPVQYGFFRGNISGDQVNLQWQTISEQNASHFIIEKSFDGRQFSVAGKVKAMNNFIALNDYYFSDLIEENPKLYYRVRQVDLNGNFHSASKIIKINGAQNQKTSLNVYPNPARQTLWVEHDHAKGNEQLTIYNAAGKKMMQEKTASAMQTILNIGSLGPGVYYMVIECSIEKSSIIFLVN